MLKKTLKLEKAAPYMKIRFNLLDSPQMADMMSEGGCMAVGTVWIILSYLSRCENFIGNYNDDTFRNLATRAHKRASFIKHIIDAYGLFDINGKHFESKIDVFSNRTQQKLNNTDDCINKNAQCARDVTSSINHLTSKDNYSTSSTSNNENAEVEDESFSHCVEEIFSRPDYQKSCVKGMELDMRNEDIRRWAADWFVNYCKLKGKMPADEQNIKAYFSNLMQPGFRTRAQFDRFVKEQMRDREVVETSRRLDNDGFSYETLENGHRYGQFHELIEDGAPKQEVPNTFYSWIHHDYIRPEDVDVEAEREARRKSKNSRK